jgi:proteasome lid subunit RPN8/RPN11
MVRVRKEVIDAILAHARAESPRECCGLLIGYSGEIVEAVPTVNVAADPIRRYEIDPLDYLRQIKRCRTMPADGGHELAVLGAYHSHPNSPPEPSQTDVAEAFGDFLFLIVGPVTETDPIAFCAYQESRGDLQRVDAIIVTA